MERRATWQRLARALGMMCDVIVSELDFWTWEVQIGAELKSMGWRATVSVFRCSSSTVDEVWVFTMACHESAM